MAMKIENKRLTSEGKTLEITPLLYSPDGTLMSLPPTIYRVPGWLLGFGSEHVVGYPHVIMYNERHVIPSNPQRAPSLSFMIRIYENQPGVATGDVPEISEEWATIFATLSESNLSQRVAALEAKNN